MENNADHRTLIYCSDPNLTSHLRSLTVHQGSIPDCISSSTEALELLELGQYALLILAIDFRDEDHKKIFTEIKHHGDTLAILILHERHVIPKLETNGSAPVVRHELPLGPFEFEDIFNSIISAANGPLGDPIGNKAVLLVDDDEALLQVLTLQVKKLEGIDVFTACDGVDGYTEACNVVPDVIVTDMMMPRVNGKELTDRIRANPKLADAHIIMLSTIVESSMRAKFIEAGADDFVSKPYEVAELTARIQAGIRHTDLVHRLRRNSTELAESNRQLTILRNRLLHQEKIAGIGMLAGGVAHEFNNIMTAIVGHSEFALETEETPMMKEALQIAISSGARAIDITKTLRGFAGEKEDDSQDVDIEKAISSITELIREKAAADHVTIDLEYCGLGEISVKGDSIKEVFLNLINNALEAMHPDGGSLTITTSADDTLVRISFMDTGGGISEDHIDYVFDPFFTTKGVISGGLTHNAGMGLSMCYGVIESCGGYIDVTSVLGEGSTFTIVLPV